MSRSDGVGVVVAEVSGEDDIGVGVDSWARLIQVDVIEVDEIVVEDPSIVFVGIEGFVGFVA